MADRDTVVARIRRLPVLAACLVIGLGVALLQGFVLGVVPFVPTALFLPSAQPLDAVLFVLAGAALLALRAGAARFRRTAAALAAALASILLAEYLLRVDLGLDSLLFPDQIRLISPIFPGRPAPLACAGFLLLGLLLLAGPGQDRRPPRWYGAMLLAAILAPVIAIAGHLGGVPELYGLAPGSGVALHAAFGLLLLAVGLAAATHRGAVVDLLVSHEPGTVLLRRLLPLAILLPTLFAVGSAQALRLGFYQVHVGLAAFVGCFIGISLWAAFHAASVARRVEGERRASDHAQAELELRNRLLEAEATAQTALRESEEHTRELLDILSHTPVTARGLDGRIRFWSAGAERLYGWSSDEAVKAGTHDFLGTELPVLHREAVAALLEHGEWLAEITRRTRAGATLRIATHWILHRDAGGRPDAVIEVDDDVSEQRQAEEAVRTSEARYRALVAATARIVWTVSADGRTLGDMSQWEAFTGQPAYEAAHSGWIRALLPEDQLEAARAWNRAVRERKALATQHRLRRRDGEYRHMEVRAVPVLDEHGNVREWVGAHTDVTDRVKAEEQLAQAQKLQAVGTLAGGVAHEVNNQLMAVLGFGEFVVKELGQDHPQTKDVEEMIRAAMRAAQVAQQLLTFSRRQVHQVRTLSVHGAVATLAPVLERLLGADKTLAVLPDRSRSQIMADPTQVDQVLINLAANARDAMQSGGRLTIATDEVTLDEEYAQAHSVSHLVPGPYVRLTVSDTGCGIDRATLAKIFEPFFTTKPVGSGTGLGLSTVYGIVKQHDGFIWAYSELGMGTTIKLYFPAATGAAAGVAEPVAPPATERKPLEAGLVLVVEDEAAVRHLVRRSLEAVGLTVLEAENGQQALEVVATRRERPTLVLTDVIMPGLNGRELSERLATTQPGLRVLFMSGYTGEDVQARSLLPDQAAFIQKPFAPEELVARVRGILAQ
ncbi:MAG: PAS domain S-box protein [Gemmatimonadales bacterium]